MKRGFTQEGLIKWFSELSNKDISIAGGKGASLAEMSKNEFPIPPGFVVTAQAYSFFLQETRIWDKINRILANLNIENTAELTEASKKIRLIIEQAELPPELEQEIVEAYDLLGSSNLETLDIKKNNIYVAVRSSATTEDLADASFAGQQDSFLGVKGHEMLLQKIKECFSSLFTARAIYYRQKKNFSHDKSYLAVVVQKMINSDKSGVIFSQNPLKNDNNIVMEAVFGLGEGIVSGRILPDHYVVGRNEELIEAKVADKKVAMVRAAKGDIEVINLEEKKSKLQVLNGYEIKRLSQYAMQLEEHYKKPQDIEFAIEGSSIYIVQSRPITTKVVKVEGELHGTVLFSGLGASPGIGSGPVRIVKSLDELDKVKKGDVLVTIMTNPDMVVSMQKAAAIITDEGGVTSHAAIVSREMGIPAIVGTRVATSKLKEGQFVTVDGNTGRVIDGKGVEKKAEVKPIVNTRTKIKVIVDLPDYASRAALSGSKGVGLVRLEGIIASNGKHPVWYLKNDKMKDYVAMLSSGLKKIASHFNEIWVRTSDIRSDEYTNLEGAPQMHEGNPMLGNHGIRFSLRNADILEAEIMAVKEVADEFSDKVLGIMMPQIISTDEVRLTREIGKEITLPKNVKFGIMVETPAAVQIIEDLCNEGIAFVSFGTNDLTQYTLALDRNNQEIQEMYNEMHPAVLASIKHVIGICKKHDVETSICGQAGSREDMVKFLLAEGIDSISVNADAARAVSELVAKLEQTKTPVKSKKQIEADEEIILKALEDNYSPGTDVRSEVPSLNDAIPIDSEHFFGGKDKMSLDI